MIDTRYVYFKGLEEKNETPAIRVRLPFLPRYVCCIIGMNYDDGYHFTPNGAYSV